MKVLVTGGSGFIGSNFIKYWLDKYPKDTIVNLDLLTYASRDHDNTREFKDNPRYKLFKGDIRISEYCEKAMQGVDIVVHFAAETHVDNSITSPQVFFETNVLGTVNLLEAARKHKVKHFHLVSTDEVYGDLPYEGVEKFTRRTPYNPRNPYAASKAAEDHAARSYFHTYKFPITITNCSNNFGPNQHKEKLIPKTILNALANKKIPVYGKGLNIRDWLYVTDHCQAIDMIIESGTIGETYLIGGVTQNLSNIEVVKMILDLMKKPHSLIEYVEDRLGHDRKYALDWHETNNELGWYPQTPFLYGLESTIAWYKDNYEG